MRNTRMMTMILWTGGREGFLIVHFLCDALDCIWCAVNRITVDQHDGQLQLIIITNLCHEYLLGDELDMIGYFVVDVPTRKVTKLSAEDLSHFSVSEWDVDTFVPPDNRTFMLESNTISYWTGHYEWSSGTMKLLGWHKASVDFKCILFHCSYSLGKYSVI